MHLRQVDDQIPSVTVLYVHAWTPGHVVMLVVGACTARERALLPAPLSVSRRPWLALATATRPV